MATNMLKTRKHTVNQLRSVSTTRVHGPSSRTEFTVRVDGPRTRVHFLTPVNSDRELG